jgi:nucleoside-diphosphate-sugar epimerase
MGSMSNSLIWISGASSGIGKALSQTVPWDDARVIGISRSAPPGAEHLEADLADPGSWPMVGESFRKELAGFDGERVVFVHAAGAVDPLGYAGRSTPTPTSPTSSSTAPLPRPSATSSSSPPGRSTPSVTWSC